MYDGILKYMWVLSMKIHSTQCCVVQILEVDSYFGEICARQVVTV